MDRDVWADELAKALVIANTKMYASGADLVWTNVPGEKCNRWQEGDWFVIDRWYGSLRAPGFTVVIYKGKPAWTNTYFGPGLLPRYYPKATFVFDRILKPALLAATPFFPVRGGSYFEQHGFMYTFAFTEGNLLGGDWFEQIMEINQRGVVFQQRGRCELVIHKNVRGEPLYPWDFVG